MSVLVSAICTYVRANVNCVCTRALGSACVCAGACERPVKGMCRGDAMIRSDNYHNFGSCL